MLFLCSGGADRDRTDELMNAIQMGRLPELFFNYLILQRISIRPVLCLLVCIECTV